MDELARLQDNIKNFSTVEARAMIEADLGAPIEELFSEFTAQPIAAASLAQVWRTSAGQTDACDAGKRTVCGPWCSPPPPFPPLPRTQVYRARLRSTGQEVAVKVQRPAALSTISKVRKPGCGVWG
jgi:predicted unusual protein kinase regulating ubiquinone biosynthesis (AarF/ABC1/UbiB family)